MKSGKCLWGRGRPLLKRARREIRRHSRLGDCPGVWRFQKAAPGSRFPRRGERAGSGLAPEPCCLARNRHACPGSRRSLPSPQFFVANADGSPRRLFFFFTFSSPSSSPAPPSLAFPFGSREASAVALDRLELRATREEKKKKKSLSLKKKKKISDGSPLLPALSKLELHAGFRSPFSSAFLRSEPPEGVWFSIRILLCVLCSRASLPCPKT